MALNENNTTEQIKYHCYDCGGIWTKDEVDIFPGKDSTKYVCKECRGRCLPEQDVKKVIGVKSIRQRYRNRRIGLYVLIAAICLGSYFYYDRRVTINDYKNYLVETANLRKLINSHLGTFREDYKIIQSYKNKQPDQNLTSAQYRLNKAKKYIFYKTNEVDKIEKPDKQEIIALYNLETGFWRDPSYINFIKYQGEFNNLKKKYDNSLFDRIINSVKKQIEKQNKNTKKTVNKS